MLEQPKLVTNFISPCIPGFSFSFSISTEHIDTHSGSNRGFSGFSSWGWGDQSLVILH